MIEVYLNDSGMSYEQAELHFKQAHAWAKEFCSSYQGCDVQDVSDVSYQYDQIALYQFDKEADVLLFKLRWEKND